MDFAEGRVIVSRAGSRSDAGARRPASACTLSGSLNGAHQSSGGHGGSSGPAPDTPQATLGGGLLFKRGAVEASLVDRWTGGSFGDVGGSRWIAPYNQLDLSAGTTLRVGGTTPLALKAQAFNLLDSRKIVGLAGYTVASATPLFWTEAGTLRCFSARPSGSDGKTAGSERCEGEHSCRSRVGMPQPPGSRSMLTILIVVLVVLALGGGGYGYRSGWYGGSRGTGFNGLGLLPILLIIVVLYLLFHGMGATTATAP